MKIVLPELWFKIESVIIKVKMGFEDIFDAVILVFIFYVPPLAILIDFIDFLLMLIQALVDFGEI
ncbi:hypothetical protein JW964_09195 [candidate division KSB1 bacterium]|nr:hypothetical protein [candidate division KSB1 bacterium]